MSQVVTNAGEALFAQKAQANEQLDIDTFIFAYVPGQDSQAPVDRSEGLPPTAQRVHTQPVQQVGRINSNTVVYSTVLNSLTGPFEFNWVGLYSSVNNTLVAISHVKSVNKTITELGNAGNTLNRNFAIEYSGISDMTGITVAPETWQLDFSARLSGMDELTRNFAKDLNGQDCFIDDGFKVVEGSSEDDFDITIGVGYVNGLRVKLETTETVTAASYPKNIYVDAYFDGDASSTWKPKHTIEITSDELVNYTDTNGKEHYLVKVAEVTAADEIEDLRLGFGIDYKIISNLSQEFACSVTEYKNLNYKFKVGKIIYLIDIDEKFKVISGPGLIDDISSERVNQSLRRIEKYYSEKEGAGKIGTLNGNTVQKDIDTNKVSILNTINRVTDNEFKLIQIQSSSPSYWYTVGDGIAPDIVFDATNPLGLNTTGSDVDSIVNLGKKIEDPLLPASATKSVIEVRSGFNSIKFGGVYEEYTNTTSAFAADAFSTTKTHALNVVYVNNDITSGDSIPLFVGDSGGLTPRLTMRDSKNPLAYTLEYFDGTISETSGLDFGGFLRSDNSVTVSSSYYENGALSQWLNGALMFVNDENVFDIESMNPLAGDSIGIGALTGNNLPLDGNILAASMDNNDSLNIDDAYQKAKSLFYRFGGVAKSCFEIGVFGQSNAEGNFTNADPYNFAAGEAYYYEKTSSATGTGRFFRGAFGHDSAKIGDSCPAIWFAAELKRLTGLTPLFQNLTFSGEPISPALGTGTFYQCPKNSVGDAAGQTSRIYQWANDFRRMKDLCDYSPEFSVKNKIAYFMCGEADARSIADLSSGLTKDELKSWLNSWLNSLSGNYGFNKFAIVNIGRRGNNQTTIDHYSTAIATVRSGISEVISERSDCFDVFPHLNHIPDPFVLDDLIVDSDGAWVSGQANNADGLHYTDKMYKAIGITAARNFYMQAIN